MLRSCNRFSGRPSDEEAAWGYTTEPQREKTVTSLLWELVGKNNSVSWAARGHWLWENSGPNSLWRKVNSKGRRKEKCFDEQNCISLWLASFLWHLRMQNTSGLGCPQRATVGGGEARRKRELASGLYRRSSGFYRIPLSLLCL